MTAIIPQCWQDETATITDDLVDDLKTILALKQAAGVLLVLFPILGIFLTVGCMWVYIQANRQEQALQLDDGGYQTMKQPLTESEEKAMYR